MGTKVQKKPLKLEKVWINYNGQGREIDGYRVSEFSTVHRSVNKEGLWTVTHNSTGYYIVDGIRTRSDAIECASKLRRSVHRLRKQYAATVMGVRSV